MSRRLDLPSRFGRLFRASWERMTQQQYSTSAKANFEYEYDMLILLFFRVNRNTGSVDESSRPES